MNGRNTKPIPLNENNNVSVTVLAKKIDESIFSFVHKGYLGCIQDGKKVAVKIPKQYFAEEKVILEELKEIDENTEGKNFIIHYHGTITLNQHLAFVFEYANIGNLCGWILPESKHYNIKSCINMSSHIAKGLLFLHDHYFLHRDLNPSNILLQGDRKKPKAIISDFGQSTSVANRTQNIYGAICYRAPELLLTPKNCLFSINGHTFATDIFSFGMVMAAMILRHENPCHLTKDDPDILQKLANEACDVKKRIGQNENSFRFKKLIPITFWCLEEKSKNRPHASDIAIELDEKNQQDEASLKFSNYMNGTTDQVDVIDLIIDRVHDFRFT